MKYTLKHAYIKEGSDLPDDYHKDCHPDGPVENPYYIFSDGNDDNHTVKAFKWDGPYGYEDINIVNDKEKLHRFSLWLEDSDIIIPQYHNFDWFSQLYERFSQYDDIYSDKKRIEIDQYYVEDIHLWAKENIKKYDNVVSISFQEEQLFTMIENTINMLKYVNVKTPKYDLFKISKNNVFDFHDDAVYSDIHIFTFKNQVIVEFNEYDKYGMPLYRDNQENEIVLGNIPCTVLLRLDENDYIPDIEIFKERR